MRIKFKDYLLTEGKQFLASRIQDVLELVEDLVSAGKQVGARQLLRNSEAVVNQIRKILHQSWSRTEHKYLRRLQACGVAIMKTIDEKGELRQVLVNVRQDLLKTLKKLGVPTNKGSSKDYEEPEQPPGQQQQAPAPQQQPPQQQPPAAQPQPSLDQAMAMPGGMQ